MGGGSMPMPSRQEQHAEQAEHAQSRQSRHRGSAPPLTGSGEKTALEVLPHGKIFCKYCYPTELPHMSLFSRDALSHLPNQRPIFKDSEDCTSPPEHSRSHADSVVQAIAEKGAIIIELFCRKSQKHKEELARRRVQVPDATAAENYLVGAGAKLCKTTECPCCPDIPLLTRVPCQLQAVRATKQGGGWEVGSGKGAFALTPVGDWTAGARGVQGPPS